MKKPQFTIKETQKGFVFAFATPGETSEAHSESYTSKQMCEHGIISVKENCKIERRYELKTATNGLLYFLLYAKNGEVILKSKLHKSESSRENGILLLKQFAEEAEVLFIPYEDHD